MTVIFFSRLFYPHIGGVEKHVYEISKRLRSSGYNIIIITEQYDSNLSVKEDYRGITIYRIPVPKNEKIKKFYIWKWFFLHFFLLKSADIIHVHDVFYWYLPFRFLFLKKKIFTTFHGYEGNAIPGKKAIYMHKIAEKFSMGNICIGDFLKKWYGTKPSVISYGAVDTLKSFKSAKIKRQAVFIGRLEEETGILIYLKAITIIKSKNIFLPLLVLGEGSLYEKAKEYCLKNKINVRFLGFVTNVEEFLHESQIVFTSRYLGILEALSQKKHVFSVYNNNIKEDYLKMSPFADFIVIEKSPTLLANQIMNTLHKENKQALEQAYAWVEAQTWNHLVIVYEKLWNKQYALSS